MAREGHGGLAGRRIIGGGWGNRKAVACCEFLVQIRGEMGGILRKAGEQMMRSSPCIEVAYFEQVALIRLCLLIRASSPYLA